jgi:hypothetical protein
MVGNPDVTAQKPPSRVSFYLVLLELALMGNTVKNRGAPDALVRGAREIEPYCFCITSSTTTLPPLSAVMTLCTGAYPLSVMSTS